MFLKKLKLNLSQRAQGEIAVFPWYLTQRMGLLYLVLVFTLLRFTTPEDFLSPPTWAFGLLSLGFLVQGVVCYWESFFKRSLVWFVITLDILLLTLGMISVAQDRVTFGLFFILNILSVSLLYYVKGAVLSTLLSIAGIVFAELLIPIKIGWEGVGVYGALFVVVGLLGGVFSEELEKTKLKLKEKKEKLEGFLSFHEQLMSSLPTGILAVDPSMKVEWLNPAAKLILGITGNLDTWIGRPLEDCEAGLKAFFEEGQEVPTSGESTEEKLRYTGPTHHRHYYVESPKKHLRVQQSVTLRRNDRNLVLRGDVAEIDFGFAKGSVLGNLTQGSHILLFQDVTVLSQLEERVRQNEKLAAVGQLAAGIAHEIRNPLASVSASIELLMAGSEKNQETKQTYEKQKLMEITIREVDRLNHLITDFMEFVKPEKMVKEKFDLAQLLSEVVFSIKQSLTKLSPKFKIQLDEKIESPLWVEASPSSLRQVVWNLIVNAIQATVKDASIEVGCKKNANNVIFWVQDQGVGMSEEALGHLFEPFFTTKPKGTGLGLANSYKIIQMHQGEIQVTSTLGKGSRFEVHLPA